MADPEQLPRRAIINPLEDHLLPSQPVQTPVPSRTVDSRAGGPPRPAAGEAAGTATGLDPDTPAAQALAVLLLAQLEIMEAAEARIRAGDNPAALHAFRVACRRSRTLATRIRKVLPAAELRRFKAAFTWLSGVTGPCRDLDVFASGLESMAADADVASGTDLDPLRELLKHDRRRARARMLRALRSKRYQRFKADWRCLLERTTGGDVNDPARAARPISEVAGAAIWRTYRRLLKSGKAIRQADQPIGMGEYAALHALRKDGKKLRYLLEAFASLYPADDIGDAITSLKKLQDNLGGVVDAEVQAQTLQHYAARLESQSGDGGSVAAQKLLEDCERRERTCLEEFPRRFKRFSTKPMRRHFKHLFKPGKA